MKVCILTEGDKSIGLGHITRCLSVYQAFEERTVKPQLIVNGDETIQDLLKDKNCKVFDWLNDQQTLFDNVRNADIAFIDSYLADYDLYEEISNAVKTAVYFDDDIRIDYPKGIVLNGALLAEQMPYPQRQDITYLLGSKYTPLRKEFWSSPSKNIRTNLETIMITCGGTDVGNLTPRVLSVVNSNYPNKLKKVIIGKGFQNIIEIKKAQDDTTELIHYPDAAQMKRTMLASDIAISACGQTLYELARTGTPVIGVGVAQNQSLNIQAWKESCVVRYIGWYDDEALDQKLVSALKHLAKRSVRAGMSKKARKIVDGQGANRISKLMVDTLA